MQYIQAYLLFDIKWFYMITINAVIILFNFPRGLPLILRENMHRRGIRYFLNAGAFLAQYCDIWRQGESRGSNGMELDERKFGNRTWLEWLEWL